MKSSFYKKRDYTILRSVSVSAFTRDNLLDCLFDLNSQQEAYSVSLVGIPAAVSARENKDIKALYERSSICIVDGMPIVKKIKKKLGISNERCSAPDIMPLIFEKTTLNGKTHYFYGGKDQETLDKLLANLKRDYDGIKIVGSYCPPFRPLTVEEDNYVVSEINRLKPDFIWVGIGAPKQEFWIDAHIDKIVSGIMVGVGAGFDFFAGTLKKAPKWVENLSLEWLYRLFKEPKRLFKRYIVGGLKYKWYSFIDLFKRKDN